MLGGEGICTVNSCNEKSTLNCKIIKMVRNDNRESRNLPSSCLLNYQSPLARRHQGPSCLPPCTNFIKVYP